MKLNSIFAALICTLSFIFTSCDKNDEAFDNAPVAKQNNQLPVNTTDTTPKDTTIEFSYENKKYNKYDSSMKIGKIVTIYVNPDNPEEFMSDNSDNFMFLVISGIFVVIGLVGLIYNIKKLVELKRRKEEECQNI